MNEINLHNVSRISISERRDFETFSALTIRVETEYGNLDVVCYTNEPKTLALTKMHEDEY